MGANQTFTFTADPGYVPDQVTIDGGAPVAAGADYTFTNVLANHSISVTFMLIPKPARADIPQKSDLLFSAITEMLPAGPNIPTWPTYKPDGLPDLVQHGGMPTLMTINSVNWEWNLYSTSAGLRLPGPVAEAYNDPIPVVGATVVAVVRPVRNTIGCPWNSIVDIFYDRLVLGVVNSTGQVAVRRNSNWGTDYGPAIPNGQVTVLSLVVQEAGDYKVYANGVQIMDVATNGAFDSLRPNHDGSQPGPGDWGWDGGFTHYMDVGRNDPDGWTAFNGNIGDVMVWKVALDDATRGALETALMAKFGTAATYTIDSSAGAGGTIDPEGAIPVPQNADQPFTITPDKYFDVTSVDTDAGSVLAGPDAQTYTFTNVLADHSIAAGFTEWVLTNITGKVTLPDGITGVAGALVTASGGREPYTATTSVDGTYSIRVKPGVTYTVTAFKRGYTMAPASLSAGPGDLTDKDFTATYVGAQKLIDLKADGLTVWRSHELDQHRHTRWSVRRRWRQGHHCADCRCGLRHPRLGGCFVQQQQDATQQ